MLVHSFDGCEVYHLIGAPLSEATVHGPWDVTRGTPAECQVRMYATDETVALAHRRALLEQAVNTHTTHTCSPLPHVCVCMFVCLSFCLHACPSSLPHTHTHTQTHTPTHPQTPTYTHTYIHPHRHAFKQGRKLKQLDRQEGEA